MTTFAEATATAIRSATCALLIGSDTGYRLFGGSLLDPGNAGNVAAALRRQICDGDPDDDPGPPTTEYSGGQCAGNYRVDFTAVRSDSATTSGFINLLGPLGATFTNRPDGVGNNTFGMFAQDGSGNSTPQAFFTYPLTDSWTLTITAVTPFPGVPNDCGDPPPIAQPEPQEQPIEVTYNVDDSTEVTLDGTLVIAPVYVGINGKLYAPIQVDLGGIEWSGNIELSPDFTININPKGINDGPGTVDNPGDLDEPSPDTPEPTEPPPLGEVIIGVIVRCTLPAENNVSAIDASNIPDIYVPRLGSVSFQIDTGGVVAWTSDQDIKNLNCYIPCPAPQGATSVGVSLRPGVTGTFSAVRGQPLTPA